MKLSVAFGWHTLVWEELLALVRKAEALGFDAVYTDGDISMLGHRSEADVLDGFTTNAMLLMATHRIHIGSIRLVHHWNAAKLAQAAATIERIAPGRLRFFVSVGDRPEDPHFGLDTPPVAERIVWLDEMLAALRALWRGEAVTCSGTRVRLDGARVRPTPPSGRIPIEVGAKGPRLLRVVAAHADIWNVNLPPIPRRMAQAEAQLSEACDAIGRDPATLERSQWIFTRVHEHADRAAGLSLFRRFNPWFAHIDDAEIGPAIAVDDASGVATRVADILERSPVERPVLDLCGADAVTAHRTLDAFPTGEVR